MATKETILTAEGLVKLEEELNNLRTVRRQEVAERLKVAISYGDISENSEYDDAKSEQAFIEGRILELEQMINTATIIDDSANKKKGIVSLGSTVVVRDLETGDEDEYTIVGFTEADPMKLFISNESPIGEALMGASVGQIVEANTPGGKVRLEILAIRKR